jgi:hypothetical protein
MYCKLFDNISAENIQPIFNVTSFVRMQVMFTQAIRTNGLGQHEMVKQLSPEEYLAVHNDFILTDIIKMFLESLSSSFMK